MQGFIKFDWVKALPIIAMLLLAIISMRSFDAIFISNNSLDIHLHDTYFVIDTQTIIICGVYFVMLVLFMTAIYRPSSHMQRIILYTTGILSMILSVYILYLILSVAISMYKYIPVSGLFFASAVIVTIQSLVIRNLYQSLKRRK